MPAAAENAALAPLRADPAAAAILLDVDGTLAPIVARPDDASVPGETRELLRKLAGAYALVVCVTGRRAEAARRIVGVPELVYLGNHGFERLDPGRDRAEVHPAVAERAAGPAEFLAAHPGRLDELGVRREDKGPIQALHWRGAPDEAAAQSALRDVARAAEAEGLTAHWGRMVLEVRAVGDIHKGAAVERLLAEEHGVETALYAGDDRTDLDAFEVLRRAARDGRLRHAVCVGVRSAEGPSEITELADVVVDGTEHVAGLLRELVT